MSLGRRWPAGWALNLLAVPRLLSAWGGGTSASPALTLHADPAVPAMSTSFRSPEWVPPVRGSWTRSGEQVPGQWPLEGPGGNMVTTGVGVSCCSHRLSLLPPTPASQTHRAAWQTGRAPSSAYSPSWLPAPGLGLGLGAGATPGASQAPGLSTALSGSGPATVPA